MIVLILILVVLFAYIVFMWLFPSIEKDERYPFGIDDFASTAHHKSKDDIQRSINRS
jgi:hypothetical protein